MIVRLTLTPGVPDDRHSQHADLRHLSPPPRRRGRLLGALLAHGGRGGPARGLRLPRYRATSGTRAPCVSSKAGGTRPPSTRTSQATPSPSHCRRSSAFNLSPRRSKVADAFIALQIVKAASRSEAVGKLKSNWRNSWQTENHMVGLPAALARMGRGGRRSHRRPPAPTTPPPPCWSPPRIRPAAPTSWPVNRLTPWRSWARRCRARRAGRSPTATCPRPSTRWPRSTRASARSTSFRNENVVSLTSF